MVNSNDKMTQAFFMTKGHKDSHQMSVKEQEQRARALQGRIESMAVPHKENIKQTQWNLMITQDVVLITKELFHTQETHESEIEMRAQILHCKKHKNKCSSKPKTLVSLSTDNAMLTSKCTGSNPALGGQLFEKQKIFILCCVCRNWNSLRVIVHGAIV